MARGRHRLHTAACRQRDHQGWRGATEAMDLLPAQVARGNAGWMDARRRGKQCDHRIDRRTGLRQEHLDSHGVATRIAPVFLHQDQRQPPLQGRPAGTRHLRTDALRGAGHDEAIRAEPAEGCRHHAHHRRACCLRPLRRASSPYSLICRHRQQRSVSLRPYGQSPLAALRGREHPVAP